MSLNDIIERFTLVSGYERKEISRYLPIIIDCKEFFEERIRRELTASEMRRAVHACAIFAYRCISCLGDNSAAGSIKAGDVQIVADHAGDRAEKLWEEQKSAVADIVAIDDGFLFRAVRI